jgi:hypothetical protein
MFYFLTTGLVVDPTVISAALPKVTAGPPGGNKWQVKPPAVMKVFGL